MSKQVEDAVAKKSGGTNQEDPLGNEQLVSSVDEKLSNIFGTADDSLEADEDLNEDEELNDEEEPDEEEDEEEGEPEEEEEVEGSSDEEEESSTPEKDDEELEPVPQAYLQAAKAYGWSDEKIERMLELDRGAALDTLAGMYETRNKINAHYSAMGRHAKQQQGDKNKPAAPSVPTINEAEIEAALGKEEAAPIISLLKQQNEVIKALQPTAEPEPQNTALLPDLDQRAASAVEESGVEQQINLFFESDAMSPFKEVYGEMNIGQTMDDLASGHRKHRWAVLQKADSIIGGAKMQGRDVSLTDALLDAHLLVTQKYRDKITVDSIRKKVVKRSKGRTLKPSKGHRKPKASVDGRQTGKRSTEQLQRDTQARLNKIFK